jgi:hypothetical protein
MTCEESLPSGFPRMGSFLDSPMSLTFLSFRAVRSRAMRGEDERGICSSRAPVNCRFLVAALLGMTIFKVGAGRKKARPFGAGRA